MNLGWTDGDLRVARRDGELSANVGLRPDAVVAPYVKPSLNDKLRGPVPRSKKLGRATEFNQQYGVALNRFIALNSLIKVCNLLNTPPRFAVLLVNENGKLTSRIWWRYCFRACHRSAYDILDIALIEFPSRVAAYASALGYLFSSDDYHVGFLGDALWFIPSHVLVFTRGKKIDRGSMLRSLTDESFRCNRTRKNARRESQEK